MISVIAENLWLFLALAAATLVTEDGTCIWSGVLVAEGRISFVFATAACLTGIFIGDVLLFLAGRYIGRPALRRAPLRWFIRDVDVERSSAWFRRRGMAAIALSRFLPGTRLPTYFAAGLLDTSLAKFSVYFLVAAAVWTPLLVGAAMLFGEQMIRSALVTQHSFWLRAGLTVLILLVVVRLILKLLSFRGRRMLLGSWRRLAHWEFWPPWLFYPPVFLYVFLLGVKYRSLTLFTCANPGIEEGGFIGESKTAILDGLLDRSESRAFIPATELINRSSLQMRIEQCRSFMRKHDLGFPVVLKPDAGERGAGVSVVYSDEALREYLIAAANADVIVQEHLPGLEFGVFYYRHPDERSGRIFSITRKLFPSVKGDGINSLENLILMDPRAVCMANAYFEAQRERLATVPAFGEQVRLIEIGTHCRGSVFLDGSDLETPRLVEVIDEIATGFRSTSGLSGFCFGRFDIRTPSLEDFQQGRNFKIVELNGVTSEATNIYDPRHSLLSAYRILFRQWRIAFEIGAANRARGAVPASLSRLARLIVKRWHKQSERSGRDLRLTSVRVD
jgi:membrane protein DedA with SNARE-associated domain